MPEPTHLAYPGATGLLAGLDAIDWPNLGHAYGDASDVPGLLRDLTDADPEVHKRALSALHGNIWHQGTVYEATAFAVPFLLELVEADIAMENDELLMLLEAIANGSSYLDVHRHLDAYDRQRLGDDFQQELDKELAWVAAARAEVSVGAPIFERQLSAPSAMTRAAAAALLGSAAQSAERSLKLLIDLLESAEPSEGVRLAAALAIGRLAKDLPAAREALEEVCVSSNPRSVRVGAAIGLRTPGDELPEVAEALLREEIAAPDSLQLRYDELLPWLDFDPTIMAGEILAATPGGHDKILSVLLPQLDAPTPEEGWSAAYLMMHFLFEQPLRSNGTVADLSPHQRRAAEAIAENDKLWAKSINNTGRSLQSAGLPATRATLRYFLADRSLILTAIETTPAKPWWRFW
jgi:hypothetical protein